MTMGRTIRIRLSDADREKHDLPEWLTLDRDLLDETRADELYAYETDMGFSLFQLFAEIPSRSVRAQVACAYLAARQGGHTLAWAEFNPQVLLADFRSGDADPPDEIPSSDSPNTGGSPDGSDEPPSDDSSPA